MSVLNVLGPMPHDEVNGRHFDMFKDALGRNVYADVDWSEVLSGCLSNRLVVQLLDNEREAKGRRASSRLRKRAAELINELTTGFHSWIIGGWYRFSEYLGASLYNGLFVEQDQYEELRALASKAMREGRSLVLLPSHKSHIDYMAIHFLLLRIGISLPSVAAGDNLNIPIVGSLLKRAGAFFIRRSFGGPEKHIYSAVVAAYIEELLKRGINIEFFPEGGRSRTGKLLMPKVGMLAMIMDAVLDGGVEDAYIVPISVQYDRLMEGNNYAKELLGGSKTKESVTGLVEQVGSLATNGRPLGNIQIRIAPGFSLRTYIEDHALKKKADWDPVTNMQQRILLYKSTAYRVMDDINWVSTITPTSLVGTVLLTTRGRGIGRQELIKKVLWLRDEVIKNGGHVSWTKGSPSDIVDESLKVLGDLVASRQLLEPVYSVNNHLELSFYRNMLVHVFSEKAVIAASLHSFMRHEPDRKFVTKAELLARTGDLSRLMRNEFVFSGATGRIRKQAGSSGAPRPGEAPLQTNFRLATESLVQEGVLQLDSDDNSKILLFSTDPELWSPTFSFLCMLIWPYIESYWLCLVGMQAVFSKQAEMRTPPLIQEDRFMQQLQSFALNMFHLGDLNFFESISREFLRHAVGTYTELGFLRRRSIDEGSKSGKYLELGPLLKDISKLSEEEEMVKGFRRMGKFQKRRVQLQQIAFGHAKL